MRKRVATVIALVLLPVVIQVASTADEPEFGRVQLPKDTTIRIRYSLKGDGEPAVLLRGGYSLESWSIDRADEQGVPWTCNASVPYDKSVFQVGRESETQLPIGEPLASTLTAVKRGSVATFSHHLGGRLGEIISIEKNGERAEAPKLRIRNADGSYDRTLSFAYG